MHTFFWRGPFSQWQRSIFFVDNIKYSYAEQYMMAKKASLFNDNESLDMIMKAKTPKEQKVLGRNVKNFNPELWDLHCRKIVYDGNFAKFSQNNDLKKELHKTIGTLLVEASPVDKVWGIGLSEDNPDCKDPSKWQGTNYLGEVLTAVRRDIFKDINDEKFKFSWE